MESYRIIGKLEASTQLILNRLQVIEGKVDHLEAFKWKIVGITIGVSVVTSILFSIIRHAGG